MCDLIIGHKEEKVVPTKYPASYIEVSIGGEPILKELVLATVLSELKACWGEIIADPDLINLLYDAVARPTGLTNRNSEPITVSKSTASKIMNRQRGGNAHRSIRNNSTDQRVTASIEGYFKINIVKRLFKGSEDDLIHRLSELINGDSSIAETKKRELLALAQKNTLAQFLANVYLYSLSKNNVLTSDTNEPVSKDVELERIPVPLNITDEESSYTDALLAAYGQAEGLQSFTIDMLDMYPAHRDNFSDQRKYYFAAEAVRRGTRDLYGAKEKDPFQVLKDEMYEGVKEVWECEYKNGLTRMRSVMSQATKTSLEICRICRDTVWVGATQRKGVCHFLVKEKRLKGWVRDDDEQAIQ